MQDLLKIKAEDNLLPTKELDDLEFMIKSLNTSEIFKEDEFVGIILDGRQMDLELTVKDKAGKTRQKSAKIIPIVVGCKSGAIKFITWDDGEKKSWIELKSMSSNQYYFWKKVANISNALVCFIIAILSIGLIVVIYKYLY